jgi:lipid-binding SYLF domain-containing protein
MKKVLACIAVLAAAALVISSASFCFAESKYDKKVEKCADVMDEIMMMPEGGIPEGLLSGCKAIAIFPATVSGGFIFGARGGTGVVLAKQGNGSWSSPAFLGIGGGSFGLQIGAQATDLVLVIMNQKGLNNLLRSKFTLSGDAGVAAGPVGRRAEVGTDVTIGSIIYSYSRTKGAFVGVALEGAMITQNNKANKEYYGESLKAKDILFGQVEAPESTQKLIDTLDKYAK